MITFNRGFMCAECGPIQKSKRRSVKKVQYDTCPTCSKIVNPWERPLNERAGRCGNCGEASFLSAVWKGDILRKCKKCDEVYNVDKEKISRKGKKEYEYKPTKNKRI